MPKPKSKAMQSLLERGRSFLTPTASSTNIKGTTTGFRTAKKEQDLFPQTDPNTDGAECLQDCSACSVHYPAKFSIDEDDKLFGQVKGWDTHLIVGTGKTDWVRDVTDVPGSVMEAVGKYGQEIEMSNGRGKGKIMLSASNMPTGGECGDDDATDGSDCLLLPSWTFIDKVTPAQVPTLVKEIISHSVTNKSPLKSTSTPAPKTTNGTDSTPDTPNGTSTPLEMPLTTDPSKTSTSNPAPIAEQLASLPLSPTLKTSQFSTRPITHRALILMCSHKTRDARCGQSAPLLRKEFERILRPMGLHRDLHDTRPGGVGIYFINHVGGHKYSANVMIYRRAGSLTSSSAAASKTPTEGGEGDEEMSNEAVQGIWLARVRPEDCENIVRYTVLQGKLVKPQRQLRGGFDREKGVISW
jgi:hypothetical protein